MPAGRSNHTSTLLANGKVLVAGGQDGATLSTASVYDPTTNSWSAAAGMAVPRYLHSATLLPNGQVLVVGGFNVSPSIWSSAELYDPASNGWSPAGSLTNARVRHTTTLLPDGQALVVGGYTGAAVGSATSFIGNVETFEMTAPVVTVPADRTAEATGPGGAAVSWSGVSASDTVDGALNASCAPASGSTFTLGTHTVTCSATDAHGNTGRASFSVRIVDTTAPVVTVPADITAEVIASDVVFVTWGGVSASDLVDGKIAATCDASPGRFAVGDHTITCSATDAHGNTGSATFLVRIVDVTPPVVDTTPPVVTVPADITAEATGSTGAAVTWSGVSANDLVDGALGASCAPASGSTFALGTHTVTCSAMDAHGNVGTASFTVRVVDTKAPVVTVPGDIVVEATGPGGATATWNGVSASDLVDGPLSASCAPASGSSFAVSIHTVTCTATDAHGNTGSASFHVTVSDTTAPTLTLPANLRVDGKSPSGAVVTYTAAASDLVNGGVAVTCSPASGSTFAIATTTVTCTATDASGNSSSGSFTVTVLGAGAILDELAADPSVQSVKPLRDKIAEAQSRYAKNDIKGTCSSLAAFVKEAAKQAGHTITTAQANTLITRANNVRAILGC